MKLKMPEKDRFKKPAYGQITHNRNNKNKIKHLKDFSEETIQKYYKQGKLTLKIHGKMILKCEENSPGAK